MTEIIPTPTPAAVPSAPESGEDAGFEVMRADAVAAGRNMSAGAYIAGFLTAGEASTAPTPKALVKDLWPQVDPAVAHAIYERGMEAGWCGAKLHAAPVIHREKLAEVQRQLEEAGFHAMAGLVGRSRELALRARPVHPADGEDAREH